MEASLIIFPQQVNQIFELFVVSVCPLSVEQLLLLAWPLLFWIYFPTDLPVACSALGHPKAKHMLRVTRVELLPHYNFYIGTKMNHQDK